MVFHLLFRISIFSVSSSCMIFSLKIFEEVRANAPPEGAEVQGKRRSSRLFTSIVCVIKLRKQKEQYCL